MDITIEELRHAALAVAAEYETNPDACVSGHYGMDADGASENRAQEQQMVTITKSCKVGIYEDCAYIARIYPDRIVVTSPYIKWVGNTGGYAERKQRITRTATLEAVQAALADDAQESAWGAIGYALDDAYLMHAGA